MRVKLTAFVVAGVALILVLVPFHAFLTVWAASAFGHYAAWRLWKEFLLIPLTIAAGWLAWRDKTLRREAGKSWLLRLMLSYVLLQFLLGAIALWQRQVNWAALGEGLIEDARLMIVFFVAWVAAARSPWLRGHWRQLLLISAAVVVAFGLLQVFVLPANFLAHFGYGPATIPAFDTVDKNLSFVRVQSFLRGANPLGAYLVVVVAVIGAFSVQRSAFRKRQPQNAVIPAKAGIQSKKESLLTGSPIKLRMTFTAFSAATLIVLYFTYSRSAYLGAAAAVALVAWINISNKKFKQWLLVAAALACMLAGGAALAFRHDTWFEDTFFHTSQLSHSAQSSNQNRASALENGVHDVLNQPFGRGPGTAGPASEHNVLPPRIAENYFLQIGQESGWLGLGLFLAINILLAKALWRRRNEPDKLPLILLASLIGLTFVNLLSHAWTDDTLAYLWWGLAGIALAPIMQTKVERGHGKTNSTKFTP